MKCLLEELKEINGGRLEYYERVDVVSPRYQKTYNTANRDNTFAPEINEISTEINRFRSINESLEGGSMFRSINSKH
jgi:hypothetical protein